MPFISSLTAFLMTRLSVELKEARERGKMCASVEKTKSSMSSGTSSSSANRRNRYLNVSASTNESILGGSGGTRKREGKGNKEKRSGVVVDGEKIQVNNVSRSFCW